MSRPSCRLQNFPLSSPTHRPRRSPRRSAADTDEVILKPRLHLRHRLVHRNHVHRVSADVIHAEVPGNRLPRHHSAGQLGFR